MSDSKVVHRVIRRIAGWAVVSFFTEIRVIGGEHVPTHGPIIVTATHHNMMLDPAILSVVFPYRRILHYWAKASLFTNPIMKYILTSAGNIPVERKSSDRQSLFQGTFHALAEGRAVALFPEGTSYTEPRIMQVKDGAAWAALEYTKWAREGEGPARTSEPVMIIPAAIVYTNKSKYRSRVIVEFGQPIKMDTFLEQFLSDGEDSHRAAVKSLTATIERELIESTVNASDWNTLFAARMARDLLWDSEEAISLDDFVPISQTLIDLFSTPDLVPDFANIQRSLLTYYSLLQSASLTNSVLTSLPLPRTLDPSHPTPLPSRLATLSFLVRDTLACLIRFPFFIGPLVLHGPAYLVARLGARLAEDEEETQAQNKIVFALLLLLLTYPVAFFVAWALLWYTSVGALVAAAFVAPLPVYHNRLVNDVYEHAKRLMATWRVLVGVWAPKHWDISLPALAHLSTPRIPPENPWVDHSKIKTSHLKPSSQPPSDEPSHSHKRPPSRRLIRHVLRARGEAARGLARLFAHLERPTVPPKRVCASSHLARTFGGIMVEPHGPLETAEGVLADLEPRGWRLAAEVVAFLRRRGAKIQALEHGFEGDWAALNSDGESSGWDSDVLGEGDIRVAGTG